jgi:hypothetical protein
VRVVNNDGESGWSVTLPVTTDKITLSIPTLGDVTATGNTITVTWNAISNANGYRVEYSTDSTFATGTVTVNSSTTSVQITKLDTETTYFVRVMAIGTGDYSDSEYSSAKSVTTEQKADPPVPGVVNDKTQIDKTLATVKGVKLDKKISKPTLTSLAFTWTPATTFNADEVTFDVWIPKTRTIPAQFIATATVSLQTLADLTVGGESLTVPSGECTITITAKQNSKGKNYLEVSVSGLNAGTKYTVEMQTKSGDNGTPYSKVTKISASTAKYTAVKSLKKTTIGLYSVALTWKEPAKVPGNPTTGYTVNVFEVKGRISTDVTEQVQVGIISDINTGTGTGTASVTVEGLSAVTKYRFEVRATAGELGIMSAIAKINATTINPAKYPAVSGFKATIDKNTNAVTLSWKESKVPDTTHYEVVVRDAAGEERKFDIVPGVSGVTVSDKGVITIPPITDLELGKYTILVRAVTAEGIKSVKDAKKVITLK